MTTIFIVNKKYIPMKKLISLAITASALIFLSTGCSPSSSSSVTPASPYFMKATINGATFNGQYALTDTSSILRDLNGYLSSTAPLPVINIGITSTAVGTYAIDGFNATAAIDSSASIMPGAAYGTITISAITTTSVTGTFSFTCTDSTRVTNGSFAAKRSN